MRKAILAAGLAGIVISTAACGGRGGLDRNRPDEFAVARQAPLVIPPDYALVPPQPGAARPQETGPQQDALEALFGKPAPRSATETSMLQAAGAETADVGVRSSVGDPQTNVVNKGTTTRDIIAAPQGDGQVARVTTP
ncbi:DUF3035 domain-containing protein [Sphingomonas sp. CJ99]